MTPAGAARSLRTARPAAPIPLLAIGLAVCGTLSPAPARQCPDLVWADEFDGTALDLGRWSHQLGDGCAEGICGWGNNEEQTYKAGNVAVRDGHLEITAMKERVRNKKYTSGRIRTLGQGDFLFGRFEARIKMTVGQGLWAAFWMLPTDEVYGGWPASGEIDIVESIGSEPATVHGTIHYGDSPSAHRQSGSPISLHSGAFTDGFHEFAIEKQAGVIRWLVDDVLYQTRTPADIAPASWPFDERFHFLLNVAVGGNWPGSPDSSTVFPQVLEVDYVRVWDASFPHIAGDRRVEHMETGAVYSVGNAFDGTRYSWAVPAGATIVSGQGTSRITVDWGAAGGEVAADLSSGCGSDRLAIDVEVEPPDDDAAVRSG